jgi:hypothetical protein
VVCFSRRAAFGLERAEQLKCRADATRLPGIPLVGRIVPPYTATRHCLPMFSQRPLWKSGSMCRRPTSRPWRVVRTAAFGTGTAAHRRHDGPTVAAELAIPPRPNGQGPEPDAGIFLPSLRERGDFAAQRLAFRRCQRRDPVIIGRMRVTDHVRGNVAAGVTAVVE